MKRNISLLASLILSSTLFRGMPAVEAAELVNREAANLSFYCHMKFPPMRANTCPGTGRYWMKVPPT